jgi:hypothetical protein
MKGRLTYQSLDQQQDLSAPKYCGRADLWAGGDYIHGEKDIRAIQM